ncbi:DUF63 family protein [Halohasta litorea]|uniref:DUF63 family protein n=1 Tax=Halohasta litorea TaxID=869891 RepID=A0ABD6D6P3_9EURY|nr:DUF63 family protein [Halohasta litorea]
MVLLPEGFSLPPLPYLLGLLAAAVAVGYGLASRRPPVTARHIVGFAPWMVVGSALHVLYVVDGLPPAVAPLGGTAAVYLTVASLAGAVWLGAASVRPARQVPQAIAGSGLVVLLPVIGSALAVGADRGTLALGWPAAIAVGSVVLTGVAWVVLRQLRPAAAATTGSVGLLAVFGHALDGVSTAVGVDVLGFGERSPVSRWIMAFADRLPTAEALGSGWLFVLVKLAIVGGIVVLFADYIEEEPTEGLLLLGFIAAVGLGPGVHNLLLFAVTGGG